VCQKDRFQTLPLEVGYVIGTDSHARIVVTGKWLARRGGSRLYRIASTVAPAIGFARNEIVVVSDLHVA
jgi:hypothetical protein